MVSDWRSGKAVQWCPSGRLLDGVPSDIQLLLSDGGESWGYGYGPGWQMIFGSAYGDVAVEPGQWVVRYDEGRVAVEDSLPPGVAVFNVEARRAELRHGRRWSTT